MGKRNNDNNDHHTNPIDAFIQRATQHLVHRAGWHFVAAYAACMLTADKWHAHCEQYGPIAPETYAHAYMTRN